jgi:hypothetical protein
MRPRWDVRKAVRRRLLLWLAVFMVSASAATAGALPLPTDQAGTTSATVVAEDSTSSSHNGAAMGVRFHLASWTAGTSGSGRGLAQSLPDGAAPVALVSGRNVTVTWNQVQMSGGTPVSGYRVRRYQNGGAVQTIGSACSGVITGTSCTESNVPTGTWRYSIQPVQGGWTGLESQKGAATAVGAASLVFSSSTTLPAASLPTSLSGTVSSFLVLEGLSFRLDSPTGPTLTGSPSTVSVAGSATVSVTIPAGTDDAPHSVFAVGSLGSVASAPISILDPPVLSKLETFDTNANGKIDRVVATFTKTLATYTAGTTPWTLTNVPSAGALASVAVTGNAATLTLTEGAGAATTAVGTFTVALASSSAGIRDVNDQTSTFAATVPVDKAPPVLVGAAVMKDVDSNGKVDQVTMTVSEPLATYSAGTTGWTLANVPSAGTLSTVTTPTTTTVTLAIAEGAGAMDTSIGSFTISLAANATTGLRDAAGNATVLAAALPLDSAKPVRVSQFGYDDSGNGKFDRVAVTFSEPLTTYTAGKTGWTFASAPTGLTLNTVTVSGAVATLSLNEGTTVTTAVGSWTVALATNAAGIRDAVGNLSSYTATAVVDRAVPVMTAAPQLLDATANGKVDRVTVTMSETLAAYSAGTTPWTLTDIPSAGTLTSVAVATSTVTLTLTEGAGAADTSAGAMTLALSADGTAGVRDAAGNAASFAATAPLDKAKPIKLTANATDENGNGKFDRLTVTFSEPLAGYSAGNTPWSFTLPPTGLTLSSVAVTGAVATLALNEGSTVTTALGSWKYVLASNAAGIRDAAGNLSTVASVAPTDKAAPVLTALTMLDATGADGIVDKVTAVFSESVSTTTLTSNWTLANVPSGGHISTVSSSTATVTVNLTGGVGADTKVGSFTVALASAATGVKDAASNLSSFGATTPVDAAGPAGASLTTSGTGATAGRIEPGDRLTLVLSEPLGPSVAVPTSTTVTLADPIGTGNDTLAIPGIWASAQSTGSNTYVTADGASVAYADSPVTLSSDRTTITITVGPACSGTGCAGLGTQAAAATLVFLLDALLKDAAGAAPPVATRTFSVRLF